MSQEKVDKRKQEKANRKKTMAKEKLKKKLYIVAGALVGIAFLGWIAWSIPYEQRKAEEERSRQESISQLKQEMADAIASQMAAIQESATATGNTTTSAADKTTGNETTTSAADKTTGDKTTGDETTSADEDTTSAEEKSSEEETTTK